MALATYYECDGITLYNGDPVDVLPQLAANSFRLAFMQRPDGDDDDLDWIPDFRSRILEDQISWIGTVTEDLFRVLRPDSMCLIFDGWCGEHAHLKSWRKVGDVLLAGLVIAKLSSSNLDNVDPDGSRLPPYAIDWYDHYSPGDDDRAAEFAGYISRYSTTSDCILDPICGNADVLIAAKIAGRRAVGVESRPWCCEEAVKRLSVFRAT